MAAITIFSDLEPRKIKSATVSTVSPCICHEEELPKSKVRGGSREKLSHTPTPEARGGGWEEQPHVQGAVAAWAQEGLEELSIGSSCF